MNPILGMLAKGFVYGCIGIVIENLFTGVGNVLVRKDRTARTQSYLWMWPIYGAAGITLEFVQDALASWHWALRPLVYLPLIYGIEGVSGFAIKKIIKVCPWEYGQSKLAPFGLIHLGYSPFWLLLGFLFDPISRLLGNIVVNLAKWY